MLIIYKNKFTLDGTDEQQRIVTAGLDRIYFPWHHITAPRGTFVIGWADLNNGGLNSVKAHQGHHPGSGEAENIEGMLNGKKYVLGVFYPDSGNIYIDNALVDYPEVAQATVSAEIAHLVDFFLPMTDEMRKKLMILAHGGDATEHGHSWWEKYDYGSEYYSLLGEAFMQMFTLAYSDMDFDASGFDHQITREQAPEVRRIIGLERTDYVPDPIYPKPEPAPEPERPKYKRFAGSKVYHELSHYPNKPGIRTNMIAALRPCKTCKPN